MIAKALFIKNVSIGDSGGPLLALDRLGGNYTPGDPSYDLLVGITSFGERSEGIVKPGVYTNISYFREWIDCITEEKVCDFLLVFYRSHVV